MEVIISRKFDSESGSAEWILAEQILQNSDSIKIEQKVKSKILHDFFILHFKCLWHRIRGQNNFIFMSENQAMPAFWLNWTGAKTTTYFHDIMRIQNSKKGIDHYYFSFIYWLASKSKIIIANSTKTANEISLLYGDKIMDKIQISPPYIKSFEVNKENRRYDVIGYLGSLSDRKRPWRLIELAKYIQLNELNYGIEVWGEGELKDALSESILENDLSSIIILKGHAPESDKEDIYNSFGYFYFPTEKEGYGLSAHEASSCEVPVFILPDADIPDEVKNKCVVIKDLDEMFNAIKKYKENDGN